MSTATPNNTTDIRGFNSTIKNLSPRSYIDDVFDRINANKNLTLKRTLSVSPPDKPSSKEQRTESTAHVNEHSELNESYIDTNESDNTERQLTVDRDTANITPAFDSKDAQEETSGGLFMRSDLMSAAIDATKDIPSNETVALLAKVMPLIQASLEPIVRSVIASEVNKRIVPLEKHIAKQDVVIKHIFDRLEQSDIALAAAHDEIKFLRRRVYDLEEHSNKLEQYTRRCNVRISNVNIPDVRNYDSDSLVLKVTNEVLGLKLTKDSIDRSHPLGQVRSGAGNSLIVKFRSYDVGTDVLRGRKLLRDKRSNIFVSEDLTKPNYGLLKSLRDAKKNKRIASAWSNDGKLFYKEDENSPKIRVKSAHEVMHLLS